MRYCRQLYALVSGAFGLVLSALPVMSEPVTLFAASSLKESLEEISDAFTAQTGHQVTLSFAASSALARQIEFGAPADIFISASSDWMDYLDARDLIDPSSRFELLGNTLVIIGAAGAAPIDLSEPRALIERLKQQRLAMALVEAVPAGIYGKAALRSLGHWDTVAEQVAQTDSARAALALVALGAAPLGLVYRTDARAEPRVAILATIPPEAHSEILYPAARLAASQSSTAQQLLDYLHGATADKVFERNGFLLKKE